MRALARFKKGARVKIACYHKGCGKTSLSVTLGDEGYISLSFTQLGGVGRLHWWPNALAKSFELGKSFGGSGCVSCPNCTTEFAHVIIFSNGNGGKTIVFGYEAESG